MYVIRRFEPGGEPCLESAVGCPCGQDDPPASFQICVGGGGPGWVPVLCRTTLARAIRVVHYLNGGGVRGPRTGANGRVTFNRPPAENKPRKPKKKRTAA